MLYSKKHKKKRKTDVVCLQLKEVRRMVEIQKLITTIYILYYSLIGITTITFALIISMCIVLSKQN